MELGTYRITQPCPTESGTKLEHFVQFQRRAKPGMGVAFLAETLTNCELLEIEYVDKNGFVISVVTTQGTGAYTIELAWKADTRYENGKGKLVTKLKDDIKIGKVLIEEETIARLEAEAIAKREKEITEDPEEEIVI